MPRETWPTRVSLFHLTRHAFQRQVVNIGISHRAVRLKKLDDMLVRAEQGKHDKLALEILALAAKEAGGFYARLREPAVVWDYSTMTREERRARLRALMARAGATQSPRARAG